MMARDKDEAEGPVASRRILSIGLGVGSRLPAYCTSLGRVILAHRPAAEIDAYLDRVRLDRRTSFTVTDRQELLAVLAGVREQGYAAVNEELELGLRSIAVPVRREDGTVQLAINVGTQAARVEAAEMAERFLPPLHAAAEALRYTV